MKKMKNFNELFDEFFENKSRFNPIHDDINKIIDCLANAKTPEVSVNDMNIEDSIVTLLGVNLSEPTSIKVYIENGMKFTKQTWDTPMGQFQKIVITDINDGDVILQSQSKSLDIKLQEAIDNEDYELAAKLHNKIKNNKKKNK